MVKWSLPAQLQLKRIHDHIALDSKYYARKVIDEIIFKTKKLTDYPKIGRVLPENEQELIREIIVYSYRIIYQISGSDIDILAIAHSRQNLPIS